MVMHLQIPGEEVNVFHILSCNFHCVQAGFAGHMIHTNHMRLDLLLCNVPWNINSWKEETWIQTLKNEMNVRGKAVADYQKGSVFLNHPPWYLHGSGLAHLSFSSRLALAINQKNRKFDPTRTSPPQIHSSSLQYIPYGPYVILHTPMPSWPSISTRPTCHTRHAEQIAPSHALARAAVSRPEFGFFLVRWQ